MVKPDLQPRRVLVRGLSRRCPRCGVGELFDGWFRSNDECTDCGLRFEASSGSFWGFWVIADRIFVVAALLPFFLTIPVPDPVQRALLSSLILIPLILTMPHRLGLIRAVDFLWRIHWGDPGEAEPPVSEGSPARRKPKGE